MKLLIVIILLGFSTKLNSQNYELIDQNDEQLCIEFSKKLIDQFENELDIALKYAIKTKGIEGAFDEFSFDAQIISNSYETNDLYSIKRITDKPRNSDNKSSSYESDVLSELNYTDDKSMYNKVIWSYYGSVYTFFILKRLQLTPIVSTVMVPKKLSPNH